MEAQTVVALQRGSGNRAVAALLARQTPDAGVADAGTDAAAPGTAPGTNPAKEGDGWSAPVRGWIIDQTRELIGANYGDATNLDSLFSTVKINRLTDTEEEFEVTVKRPNAPDASVQLVFRTAPKDAEWTWLGLRLSTTFGGEPVKLQKVEAQLHNVTGNIEAKGFGSEPEPEDHELPEGATEAET